MAKNITRHVQHIKSVDTTTITVDGQDVIVAKLPEWGDLKDGEIAVNYKDGYETISIRNNNNEVVAFPNINTVNTLIDEKAQATLTFDSTPTANSTNPVTSDGIKTYVDNGDKIQTLTTYQSSTPLAVGDTHDQALSKLSKIIDDNEIVTARALTDLNDTKQDEIEDLDVIRTGAALGATALQTETQLSKGTTTGSGNAVTDISVDNHQITLTKGATFLTEHQDLSAYADGAEYDSEEHLIYLKHGNTRLANPINAADFIKDGMVNSVRIGVLDDSSDDETRYLIITFNTDAGHEDIEIPLTDIFDPSLYYTKEEIDEHELVTAAALTELHDAKADKVALNDLNTNKQDKLEFDDTPTANSTNPVTSGGIKEYVDNATDDALVIECSGDLNTDVRKTETQLTITNNITAADVIEAYEDGKKIEIRHTYVRSGAFDDGCIITSTISSIKTQTENNNAALIGIAINTGTPVLSVFSVDYRTWYLLNVQHNEQDDTNDEISIVGFVRDHPIYIDGNNEGELILGLETLTGSPFAPKFRYYDYNTSGTGVVAYTTDLESITSMAEITYSDLVTARNNNNLKPGTWYRITDYVTTTTQADTQSANHPFDVIVFATSTNTLSEEARAIQHSGDTYFANSNLNAWKIWYCLENNKVKYAWADTTNGKGVIYRMIDEWGNDLPYDFKNIQFKRKLTDGQYDPTNGTDTWVYTFNAILAGTQSDNSLGLNLALAGGSGIITSCAENVIKPFYDYSNQQNVIGGQGEIVLNKNVFLCNASSLEEIQKLFVYANKFDVNSMGNTFKDITHENTFGSVCMNNTFGDSFYSNIIGNMFISNTTEHGVSNNIIGNDVRNCQFNWRCASNMFGNYIGNCVFGNPDGVVNSSDSGFYNNTIGNYCHYLSLIGDVLYFTIGNGVYKFYTTAITTNNVIVENGVSYVTLDCPSSDLYNKWCTNIIIAQGVSGTDSAQKVITHPTVNDTFLTEYKPVNSQVISV